MAAGFVLSTADTVASAWRQVVSDPPLAVIIDVSDPFSAWGWNLCRDLAGGGGPLLLLLTRSLNQQTMSKAFAHGADQCFQPVPDQLEACIHYLSRHRARLSAQARPGPLEDDPESTLQVDLVNHRALRDGRLIHLTPTECALLELLQRVPGQVVLTTEICRSLWAAKDAKTGLLLLKQYVARLRQKIEPDPHQPIHLETIRGVGYCFHSSGRLPSPKSPAQAIA